MELLLASEEEFAELEVEESSSMDEVRDEEGWTRRWRKDSLSLERVARVVVKTVPPTLRRTHSSEAGVTVTFDAMMVTRSGKEKGGGLRLGQRKNKSP